MRLVGCALILLSVFTMSTHLAVPQTVREAAPSISSALLERDGQFDKTSADGAAEIMADAGVAGGIVTDGCDPEKYHLVYSRGETVEKALNRLSLVTGKLKWEIRDNVVNVLVRGGVPDLLNVRVSQFDWNAKNPDDGVLPRLMETPEVSQAAKAYGLKFGPYLGGPGVACTGQAGASQKCGEDALPLILHEKNSTVWQILNRIAREGHTIWVFQENRRCGRQSSFTVDLLAHHPPSK
jgi:hypothetical protein